MLTKENELEKCPKDGLPPSTSRQHAGVKQLICGNGHNWAEGSGRKSDTAKAADQWESLRRYLEIPLPKW